MSDYEFDVALSFAGEDRVYVEKVAHALQQAGVRVFYDDFEVVNLWGTDLYTYLDDVYRNKSRYAVVFASDNYSRKMWTSHERQSAQARAFQEKHTYLLPVRLDRSEVPGLRPTIGYIDGTTRSPERIAELLIEKLRATVDLSPGVADPPLLGVPLTPEDRQRVVSVRPPGWEYLLLAGGIWQGVKAVGDKRLDLDLRFARSSGVHVSREDLPDFVSRNLSHLTSVIDKIMIVVGQEAQIWAVGAEGEPGDPVRINHLCNRFSAIYEEVIDWATSVRAVSCHEEDRRLLEVLARMVDNPVQAIESFANTLVVETNRIPAHFASGIDEQLGIVLSLTIEMDPEIMREFNEELDRLRSRLRS
jgi:hypothetical protein